MIKVDIVVSCFATYEFPLYAALISRKVRSLQKYFKVLMILGTTFYLVTRLVQIAILIGLFVLGFGPESHTSKSSAIYWVGLVMCLLLTVLQFYTLVIYRAIWKSTIRSFKEIDEAPILPVTNKQDSKKASDSSLEQL